jgi:putative transposase
MRSYADRPTPANKLTDEEYQSVLNIVNMPEFADLPPSQVVPALADRGIYIASESTIYRILRNENMQHHRGRSKAPEKGNLPTTHIATAPNQVWTWDITYLNTYTRGLYYKLYMIVDIFSRKIVGWEVWKEELGELASELVERAVLSEKIKGKPLVLHSDNGGPMKSYTLKAKLEVLGVMASYSRPRVSNDNPFSESLFRTCKYRPNYPQEGFETIERAREWVSEFVDWYNNKHYHSGLNFVTPSSRHDGKAEEIMDNRRRVYNSAKDLHPQRFNRGIRKWNLPHATALNPTDVDKSALEGAS